MQCKKIFQAFYFWILAQIVILMHCSLCSGVSGNTLGKGAKSRMQRHAKFYLSNYLKKKKRKHLSISGWWGVLEPVPCCHRARGGLHPGQFASLCQFDKNEPFLIWKKWHQVIWKMQSAQTDNGTTERRRERLHKGLNSHTQVKTGRVGRHKAGKSDKLKHAGQGSGEKQEKEIAKVKEEVETRL